jgi:hypothetical protein
VFKWHIPECSCVEIANAFFTFQVGAVAKRIEEEAQAQAAQMAVAMGQPAPGQPPMGGMGKL